MTIRAPPPYRGARHHRPEVVSGTSFLSNVVSWKEPSQLTYLASAGITLPLEDDPLLGSTNHLPSVPLTLVHGRRDITCLPEASWLLHKSLPGSRLEILPDAGHLAGDPAMVSALVRATNRMRDLS